MNPALEVPAARETAERQAGPGAEGLFPWRDPGLLADPYPYYHRLRAEAPVYRDPLGFWLLSRYTDVSAVARDPRFGKDFSAVEGTRVSVIRGGVEAPMVAELLRWMLYRDPPDHRRLRILAAKAFSPRMIQGMRARVQQIVDELIGEHSERGAMDVIADFAFVLPVTVICELLGLPTEERDQCRAWAEAVSRGLDPLQTPDTVARADVAVLEMTDYVRRVVALRRRSPGDDLLTALISAEEEGSRLDEPELISTVNLLLFAGHQTTRDLIGNGLLALLEHPAETARLIEDPPLIGNAVDELTRYDSPVQMVPRWARENVEIRGCRIPAGDQVSLLLGAANRDPELFPEPDSLDLGRPNAGSLVSFGGGVHFCLGAALARLEAQIGIPALVRLPELRLVEDAVERRQQRALRSLQALPVTFRPGPP